FGTSLNLILRQGDMFFTDGRHREVNRHDVIGREHPVFVTSNPAHIKSLMTADVSDVRSATHQSPIRPIVGPDSVITAIGERHKQQRELLMPEFHGSAIAHYQSAIERSATKHIDSWRVDKLQPLADIGQDITLDVIMTAIFGIGDQRQATRAELELRKQVIKFLARSTMSIAPIAQVFNATTDEAVGLTKLVLHPLDKAVYAVIQERRRNNATGSDIMSVLLAATRANGDKLSDREIRDELLALLLAGHETTSNTLAWTFERLTRHADEYHRVQDAVRANGEDPLLQAVIYESMRSRPLVPIVGRQVMRPWQIGDEVAETGSVALISILLLHHRDELYPKPFAFQPDRFLNKRIAPHTFIPFGGGNRRCLGATLAMAELNIVTREILRRVDLKTHDRPGETPKHRNVTMIPANGGIVKAHRIN
ncbi:MAG: cytochrome P450, partial [Nocardiaceae bacterium]|nr:cytochrome P450 [Nocardiaceae bacterium]